MTYYRIRNWNELQPAPRPDPKTGKPIYYPWLRLYSKFLNSRDYIQGTQADRLLMIILLCIANDQPEHLRGFVRADTKLIQSLGRLPRRPNLEKLVKIGFIISTDEMTTALQPRDDRSEKRREQKSNGAANTH